MICVNDLLNVPGLSDLNVVAGQNGLGRQINTVTLLDAPDGPKWLKGGEFVLTSAYIFNNNYELLEEYILALIEQNASGLGVKTGRFLNSIPDQIIEIAGNNQFPIIQIPYKFVWTDIISRFYQLKYGLNKKNVAVEPDMVLPLFEASRWGGRHLLRQMMELFQMAMAVYRPDRTLVLNNGVPGILQIEQALSALKIMPEPKHPEKTMIDQYVVCFFCLPLSYNNVKEYLAVASEDPEDINEFEKIMKLLDGLNGKDVLALRERSDAYRAFLHKVISADVTPEEIRAFEQSRAANKKGTVYNGILILASEDYLKLYQKLKETVQYYTQGGEIKADLYLLEHAAVNQVVVMLELYGKKDKINTNVWVRGLIRLMNSCFDEGIKGNIVISDLMVRLKDIARLYEQARLLLQLGVQLWPDHHCHFYPDYSIYAVLQETEPGHINFDDCLLLTEDKSTMAFLPLETAEVYIESGNYKRAAAKLFIHENTLRYRINKINELLNINLENPVEAYQFLTKLKLWKLYQMKEAQPG